MAIQRRNNMWFAIFFVLFVGIGYGVISGAVAGSQPGCNGGPGRIAWVWRPFPGYKCVVGLGL